MGDKLKEMLMLCFKSAFWQLGNTLIFFEGKVLAQHLSWTWCVNFWFVVTCLYIWIPPSDSEWWTSFITIMKSHLMQWVKQLNTSNEINILAWNACPTKPFRKFNHVCYCNNPGMKYAISEINIFQFWRCDKKTFPVMLMKTAFTFSKSFLFLHNGRSFGSLICCFSTEKEVS